MSDGAVEGHCRRQERKYEMKERRWDEVTGQDRVQGSFRPKSSKHATFGRTRRNSGSGNLPHLY